MRTKLSTTVDSRDNNFNLIRLCAALLVLFSHSFALVGAAEPLQRTLGMTWGSMAVDVFFITSGFLVTRSYCHRNTLRSFAKARFFRIYPALFVAICFCVFVVGTVFTTLNVSEYFLSGTTLNYFVKNSVLLFGVSYHLPGVFSTIPYKETVNGSLWTLPFEIRMYALLPLVFFLCALMHKRMKKGSVKQYLLILAVAAVIGNIINHFYPFSGKFMRLFSMFFVGGAYYLYRDYVYLSFKVFFVMLLAVWVSSFNADMFFLVYVLSLPYILLCAAYLPAGRIRSFNKVGDYSYGVYIYAFPVQQSLASILPGVSIPMMFGITLFVTLTLAGLSWHFVEKRFLIKKESIEIQSASHMRDRQ